MMHSRGKFRIYKAIAMTTRILLLRVLTPALLLILAQPKSVFAKELNLESKLTSVTVFPRGAEINRRIEIALEAGAHTLVINDLPASIVNNSVRVEGESDGKLEIGSVDARHVVVKKAGEAGPDANERSRIEKEIEGLRDQIKAQQALIDTAAVQKELAQNLTKTPLQSWRQSSSDAHVMPDWSALFDVLDARLAKINQTTHDAEIKQREFNEKISVLEQRLRLQPVEETERTELTIHAEAGSALKGRLKLRYQVNAAHWTPFYDARLNTGTKGGDASLALVRRAEVNQSTGEDWEDAELSLSTTRPGGATAAPELPALKVDFLNEMAYGKSMTRTRGPSGGGMFFNRDEAPAPEAAPAPAAAPKAKMAEETAVSVESNAFQAVFHVPGRSSVKSGVGAKKLFVLTEETKPSLTIFSVPKKDPTAYLSAKFTHGGEAPLLAGAVALYRDGVYIGQGHLPLVVKGEERELGFGADDAVKVTRVETKRAEQVGADRGVERGLAPLQDHGEEPAFVARAGDHHRPAAVCGRRKDHRHASAGDHRAHGPQPRRQARRAGLEHGRQAGRRARDYAGLRNPLARQARRVHF